MIAPVRERKTYEDYAALEEGAPYQLIDGALVMSPAPTLSHQMVVWELGTTLRNFVQRHQLGLVVGAPVDVYFSETETYQPDIVFVSEHRMDIVTEQRINAAPDLIVEVLSPSTGYYDLTKKRRVYEASGVAEYWIVDPIERTVEVLAGTAGAFETVARARHKGEVRSRLLDGFAIDLERLFAF